MTDRSDPAVIWALPPDETGIRGDYHTSTLSGAVRYIRADLVEKLVDACGYIVAAGDDGDEMTAIEKASSALFKYRQALSGEPQ